MWIDEERCQLWLDYMAQYRQEWDENRGMFLDQPYHDFTSHAADVHRGAAVIEDLMTNDDEQPVPDEPEPNDDIYE